MTQNPPSPYMKVDGNTMTGTIHTDPITNSLRNAAAIAAMQGALSNQTFLNNVCTGLKTAEEVYKQVASVCVHYADALLTELGKEKE